MATGHKAQVNQPASWLRKAKRLERLRASISQIENQLKTQFRYAESKAQAEAKLVKLKAEAEQTAGMLKELKESLDKLDLA